MTFETLYYRIDMIKRDEKREELERFWEREGHDDYDTILD